MIEINKNPSHREIRQFAGIWFPAFCAVIGAIVFRRAGEPLAAIAVWSLAVLVAGAGLARPSLIRPLFVGMMYAVYPVGWVFSHILLALVFFGVLTPIGLAMRLARRDPLRRRLDPSAETYWISHRAAETPERYFRQF